MTFVLCMNNKRYRRRLKLHVIYAAVPSNRGSWFLVDESGVAREYHARYFVQVELTPEVAATFE